MAKIKDIIYSLVIVGYVLSVVVNLWMLNVINTSIILACIGALLGILGGVMCFSIGFNKYHIAREKGLDIPRYRSPSIIMGLALFCLGLITLGPFFGLALPFVKMQLSIKILFWVIGLGLFFLFAGLAFLNRDKERKL